MESRPVINVVAVALISCILVSCSSTPTAPIVESGTVFDQPLENVHQAAVDALRVTGFEVTKQEPTYVEGFRPRQMGLFVGSGGETVGVWLAAQTLNTTAVRVDTAKSFVGIVGQKNWDAEIINEIREALAARAAIIQ